MCCILISITNHLHHKACKVLNNFKQSTAASVTVLVSLTILNTHQNIPQSTNWWSVKTGASRASKLALQIEVHVQRY